MRALNSDRFSYLTGGGMIRKSVWSLYYYLSITLIDKNLHEDEFPDQSHPNVFLESKSPTEMNAN